MASDRGHLSVFDRPKAATDDPTVSFGPQPLLDGRSGQEIDASTVRLALVDERGRHAFVALGATDGIYLLTIHTGGGGACGAPRAFLDDNGVVCLQRSSNSKGSYYAGIVGDEVTAVYIGNRPVAPANNVFMGDALSADEPIVTITEDGPRDISPKPPPRTPEEPVELPRYRGEIELYPGRRLTVEIDDLDSSDWRGVPRVLLLTANTPERSLVEVRLLDGPRAGDRAPAEFNIDRDAEPAAVLLGKAAFA